MQTKHVYAFLIATNPLTIALGLVALSVGLAGLLLCVLMGAILFYLTVFAVWVMVLAELLKDEQPDLSGWASEASHSQGSIPVPMATIAPEQPASPYQMRAVTPETALAFMHGHITLDEAKEQATPLHFPVPASLTFKANRCPDGHLDESHKRILEQLDPEALLELARIRKVRGKRPETIIRNILKKKGA